MALKGNQSDLVVAEGGWDFEGVSFWFVLYRLGIGVTCIFFKWIKRIWLMVTMVPHISICITYNAHMHVHEHTDIHKYVKGDIITILQTGFSPTPYNKTFQI